MDVHSLHFVGLPVRVRGGKMQPSTCPRWVPEVPWGASVMEDNTPPADEPGGACGTQGP